MLRKSWLGTRTVLWAEHQPWLGRTNVCSHIFVCQRNIWKIGNIIWNGFRKEKVHGEYEKSHSITCFWNIMSNNLRFALLFQGLFPEGDGKDNKFSRRSLVVKSILPVVNISIWRWAQLLCGWWDSKILVCSLVS